MTPGLLARMREAARKVVQACGYTNAGTVECLVYGEEQFAFLEMNARLQVEHPVTELVWTVDLVVDQIRVAAGERLGYGEEDVEIHGWAIECRIAAEDPYNQFLPSSGTVYHYREPAGPGVRVESGLYSGMPVSVHYDPMLAKIVTWGVDREQARRRMLRALSEFRVVGVQTNVPFHVAMLQSSAFRQGAFHTLYVEQEFSFGAETRPDHSDLAALAAAAYLGRNGGTSAGTPALSPQRGGWGRRPRTATGPGAGMAKTIALTVGEAVRRIEMGPTEGDSLRLSLDGVEHVVELHQIGEGPIYELVIDHQATELLIRRDGRGLTVIIGADAFSVERYRPGVGTTATERLEAGEVIIRSPMTGMGGGSAGPGGR